MVQAEGRSAASDQGAPISAGAERLRAAGQRNLTGFAQRSSGERRAGPTMSRSPRVAELQGGGRTPTVAFMQRCSSRLPQHGSLSLCRHHDGQDRGTIHGHAGVGAMRRPAVPSYRCTLAHLAASDIGRSPSNTRRHHGLKCPSNLVAPNFPPDQGVHRHT
jgi:hypothetical protein